jgi:hypothetical protein
MHDVLLLGAMMMGGLVMRVIDVSAALGLRRERFPFMRSGGELQKSACRKHFIALLTNASIARSHCIANCCGIA